jgi:hypothetical protein
MTEQQTEQATAVEKAEAILADLEAKRAAHIQKGVELQGERAALGYDVHAANNQKARKRLDELNRESAEHASELSSIDAAIGAANERLAAAQRAAAISGDRQNALELREALKEFIECGVSLDEVCAALADEGMALRAALNRMHVLGSPFPTHEQVNVLGTNAILTALAVTPWKREFRTLAPRERRTFGALVREWAARIEANNIKPRLGEGEPAEETENAA